MLDHIYFCFQNIVTENGLVLDEDKFFESDSEDDLTPVTDITSKQDIVDLTPAKDITSKQDEVDLTPVTDITNKKDKVDLTPVTDITNKQDKVDLTPAKDITNKQDKVDLTPGNEPWRLVEVSLHNLRMSSLPTR